MSYTPDLTPDHERREFAEQWKDAYNKMQADVLKRIDEFDDKWCMYSDKKEAHEYITEALREGLWDDYKEWNND